LPPGLPAVAAESRLELAQHRPTLRGEQLAVTLHPSDLVVEGNEADVAHVRARLAEQLAFSHAHLTWTKEGNEVEDRIHAVWDAIEADGGAHALGRLRPIEEDLGRLEVQYEEWEVLFRAVLLVERAAARAGVGPSTDGWAPAGRRADRGRSRPADLGELSR